MEKERPAFAAGAEALLTKIAETTEARRRRIESVTSSERGELRQHYGKEPGCSLGRDKGGFYVYTHRARSKSYPSPSSIPKAKIKFIESTG